MNWIYSILCANFLHIYIKSTHLLPTVFYLFVWESRLAATDNAIAPSISLNGNHESIRKTVIAVTVLSAVIVNRASLYIYRYIGTDYRYRKQIMIDFAFHPISFNIYGSSVNKFLCVDGVLYMAVRRSCTYSSRISFCLTYIFRSLNWRPSSRTARN